MLASAAATPLAVAQNLNRFEFSAPEMGTEFRIVMYARDSLAARGAAAKAFDRAAELNRLLSDYLSDSEVSRLSSAAGDDRAIAVSADLWHVLKAARHYSELSDGAFDVTVGAVTRLWRWAARRGEIPNQETILEAAATVGYRDLLLDNPDKLARLRRKGARIDLGGIAKGYAADQMLATLREAGIASALVDAGGDVTIGDPPPGKEGWSIEVEALADDGTLAMEAVELANVAVAASGDTHRFIEVDGVRYSHIVDPRSGWALTERRKSIVIAPTGMEADALASAVSVMGEPGLQLACSLTDVWIRLITVSPANGP
ncbi:MAG: FAD:protein FMN transferase, partial [Rhodothermales bacterium]|nr:FAD:protein FMN transferase [Rhodothermales bacterium]